MRNLDVRVEVSDLGFTYKEIAEKMNVSPCWLSTLMRHDLTPDNRDRIQKAVDELKKERKSHEKEKTGLSLD